MKSVDRHTFRASPTATVTVLALVQLLSAFAFLIRSDCMAGERETHANATNSLQDIRRGFATHLIRSPTFVFEGTEQRSNIDSVMALSRASRNPLIHFHLVKGANHVSVLAPVSRLVASKILRDDGVTSNIKLSDKELADAVHK